MQISVDLMILVPLGLSAVIERSAELLTFWSVIFFHELAHVLTARLLFKKPVAVRIYPFRVSMTLLEETSKAEASIIALAGPLVNLLLALLFYLLGQGNSFMTLCHLGQGLLNLLPWVPLDGGQILEAFRARLLKVIYFTVKWSITLALAVTFLWLFPGAVVSYLYVIFFLILQFVSQRRALKKMNRVVERAKKLVDNELQSVVK